MPELPEVETTRLGIQHHIVGHKVKEVRVRNGRLRWPVPESLALDLPACHIDRVERRGKYLLVFAGDGCILIHLGMSGSLRITNQNDPILKHDHIDIEFEHGPILRYSDPRRFGCMLWLKEPPLLHPLLIQLGSEPLTEFFNGRALHALSRGRRVPIKTFIMDSHVVVGVGNIYANEALYMAGIKPARAAGTVSAKRYEKLVACIKVILQRAIAQGGTTLRDFVGGDGKPGYFKQSLLVYGRAGAPCDGCGTPLREIRLAQRSSVYCTQCQK